MQPARRPPFSFLIGLSALLLMTGAVAPASAETEQPTYPRVFATVSFDFAGLLQDSTGVSGQPTGYVDIASSAATQRTPRQNWNLIQLGNTSNLFQIVNVGTGRALSREPGGSGASTIVTIPTDSIQSSTGTALRSTWLIAELDPNLRGTEFSARGEIDVTLRSYPLPGTFVEPATHPLTGTHLSASSSGTWRMTRLDASADSLTTPAVTLSSSLTQGSLHGEVMVAGLGTTSALEWEVVGPADPVSGSCATVVWSSVPTLYRAFIMVADGMSSIPPTQLTSAGCYSHSARVWETPTTSAVGVPAGTANAVVQYTPATPVPVYPIDRGVVIATSQSDAASAVSTLQETGNTYLYHPDARNVVASPGWWGISEQKWRLIQTGTDTYRFLTLDGERALQTTNELTDLPLHETNDPAYASPRFNVVTTPASWNIDQQQIRIERVAGGDGSQVILWGRVGATQQRIEVTPIGYLNIPGVSLVGTGPGVIPWTVSGYTFP